MPRYKLTIEYDGAPYQGWQWQENGPSVQGAIAAAGAKLNSAPVTLYGSGRTDSGVHALAQIAHIDLDKALRADKVRDGLNFHLSKHPISILNAENVDAEWHARFDAIERQYLYRIVDRRPRLALDIGRVWRIPVPLDVDAMHDAAQTLVGAHDFTTFRDTQCQSKSPVKTVDEISILRAGYEIHCHFRARSFLHKQVRSFVGTLVEVGLGKWDSENMQAALEARDRRECGPVAPPDGLYLTKVIY